MNRTQALAGTATAWDYSSQRAVRQLQAAVGSLGLIRLLVSASFTIYAVWEIQSFFFLKIYLAVLRDVEAAEGCRSSLFAFLRILKDQLHISEFRRIKPSNEPFLSVRWSRQQDGMKAGLSLTGLQKWAEPPSSLLATGSGRQTAKA